MTVFLLCPGCRRHFRQGEAACPFCGASALGLLPKPVPALPAGASRSRRYAASAALLASSAAVFSCGSAESAGDSETTAGAGGTSSSAGNGTSNTSNTSASTSASASTTNSATNGSSSTSDSTSTSSGGGSSSGTDGSTTGGIDRERACEGFEDTGNCRSLADCEGLFTDQSLQVYCSRTPIVNQGCGNPTFLPMCPVDGCGEGKICVTTDACGSQMCQPECSDETCTAPSHCVDGLCQAMPCDMDGASECAENFRCDPTTSSRPDGCVPIHCSENPDVCDSWETCEDTGGDLFGCLVKTCSVDEDCGECGYCMSGACGPGLGTCYQEQPAMPYGCVWPDEELV